MVDANLGRKFSGSGPDLCRTACGFFLTFTNMVKVLGEGDNLLQIFLEFEQMLIRRLSQQQVVDCLQLIAMFAQLDTQFLERLLRHSYQKERTRTRRMRTSERNTRP